MDELSSLIDELVAKGASDEEIDIVVQDYKSKQQPDTPQEEAGVLDYGKAIVSGVNRGIGSATTSVTEGVGIAGDWLTKKLGQAASKFLPQDQQEGFNAAVENFPSPFRSLAEGSRAVREYNEAATPYDERISPTLQGVAEAGGQILPMMVTGGASATGQLAGATPSVVQSGLKIAAQKLGAGSAVMGGTMTAVPEWEAAKAAGMSDDEAFGTFLKNYLVGQTEAIPVQRMLTRLDKVTGGKIMDWVRSSGAQAIEEGIQEALQTYATNKIAQTDYDPDRDPMFEVLESAKIGGLTGLILPTIGAVASRANAAVRTKMERKLAQIQLNKAIDETSTGDPELDAEIDKNAELSKPEVDYLQAKSVEKAVDEENKTAEQLAADIEKEAADIYKANKDAAKELRTEKVAGTESSTTSDTRTEGDGQQDTTNEVAEVDPKEVATRKLEELKAKLEDPSMSEDEMRVAFRELQATRNALKQIAPTPGKKGTTEIQQRINKDTGVAKQEPIVISNPAAALKQQIKQHYNILSEGVRKGADLKNDLIKKVQEITKGANLNPKQSSTILTKIRNTNLFTPGSVSKLGDFTDKVVADAEYADKLQESRNIAKKLKKLAKSEGALQNYKGAAKMFASIKPDDVDIDAHLEAGRELLGGMSTVGTAKYKAANIGKISSYLESVTPDSDIEDAAIAEDVKNDSTGKRRQQLEGALNASIEALNAKDLSGFGETEQKVINSIKDLDPTSLSNEHLATAIRVSDNIIENDDLSNTGRINAVIKAKRGVNAAIKLTDRYKKKDIGMIGRVAANTYQQFGRVFGNSNTAAEVQRLIGYFDVISAGSKLEAKRSNLVEKVEKLAKDVKDTWGVDIKNIDNEVELTAFSELYKNYGDDSQIPKIISQIKQSAEIYERKGYDQDAEAWNKAYEKFKDVKTSQDAAALMSAPMMKTWKFFNDTFNKEVVDNLEDVANKLYNKQFVRADNYTHTEYRKLESTSEDKGLVPTSGQGQPTVNPKQSTTAITANRTIPRGSAYSSNFLDSQVRGYSKSMYDIMASDSKAMLNEALKLPEFVTLMGSEKNAELVDTMIKSAVELQEGISRNRQNEAIEMINAGLLGLRKIGVTRALGSLLQPLKQVPSVMTKTAINLVTSGNPGAFVRGVTAVNLFGNNSNLNALFDQYSIGVRENRLGGVERGESLSREITGSTGKSKSVRRTINAVQKLNNHQNKLLDLSMKALTKSDAYAARVSWLGYYLKSLDDQGISGVDLTEEHKLQNDERRQQAAAYAEQMVAETQLPSNPATLSQMSRNDGNQAATLLKSILLPFSTYTINAKYRMIQNLDRASTNPSVENLGAVVGDLTEILTYGAVMYGIEEAVRPTLKGWVELLINAVGVDDDEEETQEKATQRFWDTVVNNISPLSIGAFGEGLTAEASNRLAYAIGNEGEDYEDWKEETGGFLSEKQTKLDWAVLGTGAGIYKDAIEAAYKAANVKELTTEQQNALILNLFINLFAGMGLMDAEIHNQAKKVMKEQDELE